MARLLLCAMLIVLGGCDRADDGQVTRPDGTVVDGALPTPAGARGSVTGMPTTPPPPPPAVADAAPEPIPAEPAPAVLPGTDPNAIPVDPATGLAVGAAPAPGDVAPRPDAALPLADAAAAGDVVRGYMASVSANALAAAQQAWSTTPTDGLVLELARSPAFGVDVQAPVRAGDGVANVPVRVRAADAQGQPRAASVVYTVRRVDGQWRIASASVREDAP